jgi:hypothetical protein
MIMEFVDNSFEIGNVNEKELMHQDVLKDLGRIVILDLLLNNWDRMPVGMLWKHEGNPNNLLVNTKLKRCFAIDQATTEIPQFLYPENHKEYMENVKLFMKTFQEIEPTSESPIESISKFISLHSGFEISKEGKLFIFEGMTETIQKIKKIDFGVISKIKQKIFKSFDQSINKKTNKNIWEPMMELVSEDFTFEIIGVIQESFK